MVDFRRMIPVLAVLAFLLGSAVTASAQTPLACIASGATNTPVRFEGLTEMVGDVLITCTGGTPTAAGAQIPTVNVQIILNTSITSRCMNTGNTGCLQSYSEALLILDEPVVSNQYGCGTQTCINGGNGTGAPIYGSGSQTTSAPFNVNANRNIFQGIQTASNTVTFIGIPIDPPGTAPAQRIIRITNVRANVNLLGTSSGNSAPPAVTAQITSTPSTTLPINGLATQAVGSVQRGLAFSLRSASGGSFTAFNAQQCVSRAAPGTNNIAQLRYQELFGTAFKKRSVSSSGSSPSSMADQNDIAAFGTFNTETGFRSNALVLPAKSVSTGSGSAQVGEAEWGTRLKAVFNSIPAGIRIWVDTNATSSGPTIDDARLTVAEASPWALAGTAGTTELTITNGTATAVWEVLQSDPTTLADLRMGVYVSYTANPGNNSPALGTGTVNGSYAPTSTVGVAVSSVVPRFADTSTASTIFTVVPCVTNLLFPFVTSQLGFDTGIAISSTSTDPFATSPQSGTCTLNWYGAAFTGATPTPIVTSGTTYTALTSQTLSNVAGGFSGYMIAVCRFQYAHGFAFVSYLGARNIAMGYLALVLPDPARAPNPLSISAAGSGEQLGQ